MYVNLVVAEGGEGRPVTFYAPAFTFSKGDHLLDNAGEIYAVLGAINTERDSKEFNFFMSCTGDLPRRAKAKVIFSELDYEKLKGEEVG